MIVFYVLNQFYTAFYCWLYHVCFAKYGKVFQNQIQVKNIYTKIVFFENRVNVLNLPQIYKV